jgi:hypothetical protein
VCVCVCDFPCICVYIFTFPHIFPHILIYLMLSRRDTYKMFIKGIVRDIIKSFYNVSGRIQLNKKHTRNSTETI